MALSEITKDMALNLSKRLKDENFGLCCGKPLCSCWRANGRRKRSGKSTPKTSPTEEKDTQGDGKADGKGGGNTTSPNSPAPCSDGDVCVGSEGHMTVTVAMPRDETSKSTPQANGVIHTSDDDHTSGEINPILYLNGHAPHVQANGHTQRNGYAQADGHAHLHAEGDANSDTQPSKSKRSRRSGRKKHTNKDADGPTEQDKTKHSQRRPHHDHECSTFCRHALSCKIANENSRKTTGHLPFIHPISSIRQQCSSALPRLAVPYLLISTIFKSLHFLIISVPPYSQTSTETDGGWEWELCLRRLLGHLLGPVSPNDPEIDWPHENKVRRGPPPPPSHETHVNAAEHNATGHSPHSTRKGDKRNFVAKWIEDVNYNKHDGPPPPRFVRSDSPKHKVKMSASPEPIRRPQTLKVRKSDSSLSSSGQSGLKNIRPKEKPNPFARRNRTYGTTCQELSGLMWGGYCEVWHVCGHR
ncbi:hypothetical protein Bbelb_066760 [Branchiostoma belcheri]|nr:hypothetical protein Bbelb_066760 [Branchiostoma belcheri]